MKIERTEDEQECINQTHQVGFLKSKDEYETYAGALLAATQWGKKIDEQKEKYKNKNRLIKKYNN